MTVHTNACTPSSLTSCDTNPSTLSPGDRLPASPSGVIVLRRCFSPPPAPVPVVCISTLSTGERATEEELGRTGRSLERERRAEKVSLSSPSAGSRGGEEQGAPEVDRPERRRELEDTTESKICGIA